MLAVELRGRSASVALWPFGQTWATRPRRSLLGRGRKPRLGRRRAICPTRPWPQAGSWATDFAIPGRSRALGRRISVNFRGCGQFRLLGLPLGKPDLRKCRPCVPKRRKRFFSRSGKLGVSPGHTAFFSFAAGMRFRKSSPKWGQLTDESRNREAQSPKCMKTATWTAGVAQARGVDHGGSSYLPRPARAPAPGFAPAADFAAASARVLLTRPLLPQVCACARRRFRPALPPQARAPAQSSW